MNAPTPSQTSDMTRAYFNLEPQVRNLARMTEIARFCVHESGLPDNCTEEERRAADRVGFVISHIADMARDLEKAYAEAFRKAFEG